VSFVAPVVCTVTVVDPEPVKLDGLNEAVGPAALEAMLKLTMLLKPLLGVTVKVN
jgi:hypothetical protein